MKYLAFPAIALLVVLPWLLRPGYLLLLDWHVAPNTPFVSMNETGGIAGIPVQALLITLSHLFSPSYAQALLVFLILSGAGITTALFAQHLLNEKTLTTASITAGIFAMLNLFVYNRIQMGHVFLLTGYALTPLALLYVLRFLHAPSIRRGILTSLVCGLVLLTSIHHIFLLPVLIILFTWNEKRTTPVSPGHFLAFILPLLCITGILITLLLLNPASSIHRVSQEDLYLFAPVSQCSPSIVLDSMLLASQWRNPIATQAPCTSPIVLLAGVLLLGVMSIGAIRNWRLAGGVMVCIILAILPLIPAMRDSAKFLACLALLQSALLAYGIKTLQHRRAFLGIVAFVLVGIVGFPMLRGLSGTITTTQYPASWYAFEQELTTKQEKPTILFLPWHLYMPFDFTHHTTISTPASAFFSHATILQGDNLEIRQGDATLATQSNREVSQRIEMVLSQRHKDTFADSLQDLLTQERIEYIALGHGSPEEQEYREILGRLPFLHLVHDTPGLTIWQFGE